MPPLRRKKPGDRFAPLTPGKRVTPGGVFKDVRDTAREATVSPITEFPTILREKFNRYEDKGGGDISQPVPLVWWDDVYHHDPTSIHPIQVQRDRKRADVAVRRRKPDTLRSR